MKKLIYLVVALVLAVGLVLPMATPVNAISWGAPDTTHTNVGAMVIDLPPEYGGLTPVCSGILIGPQVFLTAGHCIAILETYLDSGMIGLEDVYVNFDQDALNELTLLPVQAFTKPPNFGVGGRSDFHDLGALILDNLDNPVSITYANLPAEGFLDGLREEGKLRQVGGNEAKFTVVGYGATLYWPPPIMIPYGCRQVAYSEYQKLLKAQLLLSQNHAKGDNIGGTCYGDSGGPVFWKEGGIETLVAITSWGDQPCVAAGFNYRVDTADARAWIKGVLDAWD
ncbi:trypsin-like serine protease [Chloroflexota bacterium]